MKCERADSQKTQRPSKAGGTELSGSNTAWVRSKSSQTPPSSRSFTLTSTITFSHLFQLNHSGLHQCGRRNGLWLWPDTSAADSVMDHRVVLMQENIYELRDPFVLPVVLNLNEFSVPLQNTQWPGREVWTLKYSLVLRGNGITCSLRRTTCCSSFLLLDLWV